MWFWRQKHLLQSGLVWKRGPSWWIPAILKLGGFNPTTNAVKPEVHEMKCDLYLAWFIIDPSHGEWDGLWLAWSNPHETSCLIGWPEFHWIIVSVSYEICSLHPLFSDNPLWVLIFPKKSGRPATYLQVSAQCGQGHGFSLGPGVLSPPNHGSGWVVGHGCRLILYPFISLSDWNTFDVILSDWIVVHELWDLWDIHTFLGGYRIQTLATILKYQLVQWLFWTYLRSLDKLLACCKHWNVFVL